MNSVKSSSYPGWLYPVYECHVSEWDDVSRWMRISQVGYHKLTWSAYTVKFQVETNHEWFILRWS